MQSGTGVVIHRVPKK